MEFEKYLLLRVNFKTERKQGPWEVFSAYFPDTVNCWGGHNFQTAWRSRRAFWALQSQVEEDTLRQVRLDTAATQHSPPA